VAVSTESDLSPSTANLGRRRYALLLVDEDIETLERVKEPVEERLEGHPGVVLVEWRPSLSKTAEDLLMSGQFAIEAMVTIEDSEVLDTFREARFELGSHQPADWARVESLYVQEAVYKALNGLDCDDDEAALQSVMGWPLDLSSQQ
jgi:hypothetical protein